MVRTSANCKFTNVRIRKFNNGRVFHIVDSYLHVSGKNLPTEVLINKLCLDWAPGAQAVRLIEGRQTLCGESVPTRVFEVTFMPYDLTREQVERELDKFKDSLVFVMNHPDKVGDAILGDDKEDGG